MNPAHVFRPAVAVKRTFRVDGDLAVCRVEIDPARRFTPTVARQVACLVIVHTPVGSRSVGIRVRASPAVGSQQHPADVFRPGEAFQVVGKDRHSAVSGQEIDPARRFAPDVFLSGVDVGGGGRFQCKHAA